MVSSKQVISMPLKCKNAWCRFKRNVLFNWDVCCKRCSATQHGKWCTCEEVSGEEEPDEEQAARFFAEEEHEEEELGEQEAPAEEQDREVPQEELQDEADDWEEPQEDGEVSQEEPQEDDEEQAWPEDDEEQAWPPWSDQDAHRNDPWRMLPPFKAFFSTKTLGR